MIKCGRPNAIGLPFEDGWNPNHRTGGFGAKLVNPAGTTMRNGPGAAGASQWRRLSEVVCENVGRIHKGVDSIIRIVCMRHIYKYIYIYCMH